MKTAIWLSFAVFIFLLVIFPLGFGQLLAVSLAKLHLDRTAALWLITGIIGGSFVNIPVRRIHRPQPILVRPLGVLPISVPTPAMSRYQTIVAVNVGGCVIPIGLALYELGRLAAGLDAGLLASIVLACAINVAICYRMARPISGVGIAMPGLVSPLVAAVLALALAPEQAPPFAFIVGVMGPLIGADLFHLKDLEDTMSVVSIGGAGTFDGIVLSGIIAAYLA